MYALVTGATSGIGKMFSYKLAKEGYNLLLVGRNEKVLKKLKKHFEQRYTIEVQVYPIDLGCVKAVDQFIKWIEGEGIMLELVINNAGRGSYGAFEAIPKEVDREVVAVNVQASTYLIKGLIPYLPKGATLLQVASTAAFAPGPYMAVYYASKAYMLSFSLALREELTKKGIQVNVLCPGPTKTPFQRKAGMKKAAFAQKLAMEPWQVVEEAYRGILINKPIIVPGTINKLAVLGMSLMPPTLAAKIVACTQEKE